MSVMSTVSTSLPTDRKLREIHHWINGRTVAGTSDRFGDVYNPASGEVQARVTLATAAEVDSAVDAAAAALPGLVCATAASQSTRALPISRDL